MKLRFKLLAPPEPIVDPISSEDAKKQSLSDLQATIEMTPRVESVSAGLEHRNRINHFIQGLDMAYGVRKQ